MEGPVTMTGWKTAVACALALLAGTGAAHARPRPRWAVEAHLGAAWNLPLPLAIRQEGEEELRLRARRNTRAFEFPLYYVGRVTTRDGGGGWALDLTHHKVYLANPPAEVGSFSVSHGYNLLTLHRTIDRDALRYGFGAGVVVAHPESEVRGRRLEERGGTIGGGYWLTGPTAGALVGLAPAARDGLYPAAELRLTFSRAKVPVAGGDATVPNVAIHLTVGVGWEGAR